MMYRLDGASDSSVRFICIIHHRGRSEKERSREKVLNMIGALVYDSYISYMTVNAREGVTRVNKGCIG